MVADERARLASSASCWSGGHPWRPCPPTLPPADLAFTDLSPASLLPISTDAEGHAVQEARLVQGSHQALAQAAASIRRGGPALGPEQEAKAEVGGRAHSADDATKHAAGAARLPYLPLPAARLTWPCQLPRQLPGLTCHLIYPRCLPYLPPLPVLLAPSPLPYLHPAASLPALLAPPASTAFLLGTRRQAEPRGLAVPALSGRCSWRRSGPDPAPGRLPAPRHCLHRARARCRAESSDRPATPSLAGASGRPRPVAMPGQTLVPTNLTAASPFRPQSLPSLLAFIVEIWARLVVGGQLIMDATACGLVSCQVTCSCAWLEQEPNW